MGVNAFPPKSAASYAAKPQARTTGQADLSVSVLPFNSIGILSPRKEGGYGSQYSDEIVVG